MAGEVFIINILGPLRLGFDRRVKIRTWCKAAPPDPWEALKVAFRAWSRYDQIQK